MDKRYAFNSSQEQDIVNLYLAGSNIKEISEQYNAGRKAIKGALLRNNIDIRHGGPNASGRYFDDDADQKIRDLYEDGHSILDISKIYGLTAHHSVQNSLARTGGNRPNRTHFFDEHIFDTINHEHKAYWLGFLYADGSPRHHQIMIGLSIKDADHLEKLRMFFGNECRPVSNNGQACWLTFCSMHLMGTLTKYGIVVGRHQFQDMQDNLPPSMYRHFIRGYMDGDGFVSPTVKVGFLGQVDILTWIRSTLSDQLGVSDKVNIRQRQGIHQVEWGGRHQFKKIVEWLYSDSTIYLDRKHETAMPTLLGL